MKNIEISRIFYEMADILEMQNVQWKPNAYRKAARAIESLTEDIEAVAKRGELMEIAGVGEALARKIEEYIKTGHVREYEKLKKTVPKHLTELMEIPSVGPKTAKLLHEKLGVNTIKQLEAAVKKHKLRGIKGFGDKTEVDILHGIELLCKSSGRMLLGIALPIATEIVNELSELKEVKQILYAGSLRRMKETIRDIDILAASANPGRVMDYFVTLPQVGETVAKGKTKSTVLLKNRVQVDLRVVDEKSFGSAAQYFTGSKEHNIALRQLAIKKGYKLSEYGLFKGNKQVAGKDEAGVYAKLGLAYIEPEMRENTGEVQVAMSGKLPKLLGYGDIKGDLHVHSRWSDGDETIENLAVSAKKFGYEYICMSDHSKGQRIAGGLSEERLGEQLKEISRVNKKNKGFRVLSGSEVDILADGTLDYSEDILRRLDIVTASVHSGFKSSSAKMTNRICKALSTGMVDILGHPTGRLINQRDPYAVDLAAVFKVAKENNVVMEINANPNRLDLKDEHIKLALEHGLKFAIGTDLHNINHLHFMRYGVGMARRGWCSKKDIVNTLSLKQLGKVFR